MKTTLEKSVTYQTMEGFGGSGAWWAQAVGNWGKTADEIAKLLYSKEEGIGLSVYRYNIGAGSAESKKGNYSDDLRRAQSFKNQNNQFDFSKDAAAVNMMKKCVKYGADTVVLFVNSPIEALTKNHLGHTNKLKPFTTNLSKKHYGDFADYVLTVAQHFVEEGIPVKAISPVNEPFWIWNGGQEGCHYSPRQCRALFRVFAQKIKHIPSLGHVYLSGAENGDIRWFNKSYTRALLDDKKLFGLIDGIDIHSYFLPLPLPNFMNDRLAFLRRYKKWMAKYFNGSKIRISEWCHMNGGRDAGMESALETAKVIYEDLTILHAVSWQHWILCSPYDYCDGLIYVNPTNQTYELTKRYFVTGNFSKFTAQGAKRINIQTDDTDVKVLAFDNGNNTVIIYINPTENEKRTHLSGCSAVYITDATHDLEKVCLEKSDAIVLPPKSVSTVIKEA